MAAVEPIEKPETMEEFAARIRAELFPSSRVEQCQQLSAAVRRLAKRGVDPEHAAEAAEFDSLLLEAMRALNAVTQLLHSTRERVDLAKIKAERERRAEFWATRGGAIAQRIRKIPMGVSATKIKADFMKAFRKMTPEERATLLARLKA